MREPAIFERLGSVGPKWESQTEDGLSRETREQSSAKFRTSVEFRTSDVRFCRTSVMRRTSDVVWIDRSGSGKHKIGEKQEKFRGKRAKATQRGGRSTRRTTRPWVKTNKFAQEPTRARFWVRPFLVGIFELGKNKAKNRLESRGETLQSWQPCS